MAISNDLLSTTLYSIRDQEVDALYSKVAVLDGMRSNGGVLTENGGIKISRPLSLAEHSSITQLQSGYEPVNLAVSPILQAANYEWCDFVAPIVISRREEMENSSEHAQIRIVEARMRTVMGTLRRELNRAILVGDSSVLTDMNTLNGDLGGFIEAGPGSAQSNSVGGLSKATYQKPGWLNQFADGAGTFSMDLLWDSYIAANAIAPMGDISHVISSAGFMAAYRNALFSQERFVQTDKLDGGRMALAFNGAAVEHDPVMGFALTNAISGGGQIGEAVSAYMLNYDGIKLVFHTEGDFNVSPFENITGTTTRGAQLYVKAQLIADHLGSQAVIIDAEA